MSAPQDGAGVPCNSALVPEHVVVLLNQVEADRKEMMKGFPESAEDLTQEERTQAQSLHERFLEASAQVIPCGLNEGHEGPHASGANIWGGGDENISDEDVSISEELESIANRLRNYAVAPTEDLREIADRLDVIRGMLDGPVPE